ncbi:MAG TPA: hypothetical protein VI306_16270 [Pyrinomonadaceae bacterium]
MSPLHWLTHVARATKRVRRWFLRSLFRRADLCRPLVTPELPTKPTSLTEPATNHLAFRDDLKIEFMSTTPTVLSSTNSGSLKSIEQLPLATTFSLDTYCRDLASLRTASEWLHFGTSSRLTALQLANIEADTEDTNHFILHVTVND